MTCLCLCLCLSVSLPLCLSPPELFLVLKNSGPELGLDGFRVEARQPQATAIFFRFPFFLHPSTLFSFCFLCFTLPRGFVCLILVSIAD